MAAMPAILHVDMDAFYAAIEQRDRPECRGRPVIVGSDPKQGRGRGIVATCSYEARRFGVHSAQPISRAWGLCPRGVYLRPDMAKYVCVSNRVMAILFEFTDLVEQVSIDEAFLDVAGCRRLHGSAADIARKIQDRIQRDQGLTASVGVACSKFVAKVASDLKKPGGLVQVEAGREEEFLAPLPIQRLWGVGRRTEAVLQQIGVSTIGELARRDRASLVRRLGASGAHLWELARGIDARPVSPEEGYKSIGHEITFELDVADRTILHDTLLELAERVSERLRSHHARCRTVTVKYREADFSTFTRRQTLAHPADTGEKIFPVAWRLLQGLVRPGKYVRLIGVYASNLVLPEAREQLRLFDLESEKDRRLAQAMDSITRRYGHGAIKRAALVSARDKRL
ncbi:MAG: DNA polymerase IV [Acidobacteriota bacterium]